ncbi:MAG: hypothetical protein ABJA76_07110 [Mucilaginibacter sp.]
MTDYDIESKDFALSPRGVHLLRKRFNYKTIGFYDINKATFSRAADTKNVVLTLIVAILFIAFAVYQTIGVFEDFHDPSVHRIYIESILLPVFPLLLGFYCIYIAVKKVPLLIIEFNSEKHKLSLQDVINAGQMAPLEAYLKEKLRERFYDSPML